MSNYPFVKEISYRDPLNLFSLFSENSWSAFLDSSSVCSKNSRYSFIAIEPFLKITSKNSLLCVNGETFKGEPFAFLQNMMRRYSIKAYEDLPPFQGGALGFFSYDMCRHLESLPFPEKDDMCFPDMAIGFYDLLISFDCWKKKAWIISSGLTRDNPLMREDYAEERCNQLFKSISKSPLSDETEGRICSSKEIQSNFDEMGYMDAVKRVIDYIYSGDVFEVNISQRFTSFLPKETSAFQLYRRLRKINPAPFSAYLDMGDATIVSSSPERFLKLSSGYVETRPIKGTRPRGKTEVEDEILSRELLSSEKDRAENVMIVDLMRNDLSKVCSYSSVKVLGLCELESYATVHQLVSTVRGKLKENFDAIDLLKATFPGGSISGAPKVRAMEIIAEIETNRRGPYCGCIGYIGFNGAMDTSITIRTYAIKNNVITFQAGGAIVADSDPLEEYRESMSKAWALHKTLTHSFSL